MTQTLTKHSYIDDGVYDNHTLFVKCDCASAEQIRECFLEAIKKYQKEHSSDLRCSFKVNLVENKEKMSYGIAFVFLQNSAVYYMILGKNPDGTDRVQYIDDPSWTAPNEEVNNSGWTSSNYVAPLNIPTEAFDWGDDDEEFIARKEEEERKKKYTCPKIEVTLEPLMTLPPYKLTQDQMEKKRNKIIADNKDKKDFDINLVNIPDHAYLNVCRAKVTPVEPQYMPNILKCRGVPDWITKDDLKAEFSPFASDSITKQRRQIKGRDFEETYPFVNINKDRVAFIIFDPSTHDAQFALHMMKKTFITKRDKSTVLIFGHSFLTDRDKMTSISLEPRVVKPRVQYKKYDRPSSGTTSDYRQVRSVRPVRNNTKPPVKTEVIKTGGRYDLLTDDS